ncbi:MAG TPA: hypothetical protein PKZ41_01850, partial [Candidatus Omnitrophota bacterium]|nr:hypothetical protein [Candidatus Omnitrophota bacterium]
TRSKEKGGRRKTEKETAKADRKNRKAKGLLGEKGRASEGGGKADGQNGQKEDKDAPGQTPPETSPAELPETSPKGSEQGSRSDGYETPEGMSDDTALMIIDSYWSGEAPKKALKREKGVPRKKVEKDW